MPREKIIFQEENGTKVNKFLNPLIKIRKEPSISEIEPNKDNKENNNLKKD